MKINGNRQQMTGYVNSPQGEKTEQIERQIQSLKDEISKLDADKTLDSKAKQEKKKQLEEELANLQQQLAQEQVKKRKTEKKEEKKELMPQAEKPDEKESGGMSRQEMDALLSASTTMKQAGAINNVRVHMNGSANVLKGEIAVIEARGGNPVEKKQELSGLQEKIDGITGSMIAKYGEADRFMKASAAGAAKDNKAEADGEEKTGESNENDSDSETGAKGERKGVDVLV